MTTETTRVFEPAHKAAKPENTPRLTDSDRATVQSLVNARHERNDTDFRLMFVSATLGYGQLERVVWLLADELAALTKPVAVEPVDIDALDGTVVNRSGELHPYDPVRVPRDLFENYS